MYLIPGDIIQQGEALHLQGLALDPHDLTPGLALDPHDLTPGLALDPHDLTVSEVGSINTRTSFDKLRISGMDKDGGTRVGLGFFYPRLKTGASVSLLQRDTMPPLQAVAA